MTTPSEKHWVDAVRVDPDYNSMHEFESDGVTSQFEVNFSGGYLNVAHVKAYQTNPDTGLSEDLTLTRIGESLFQISPVPPKGFTITIWRDTPKDVPLLDFTDGAMITAENLDRNAKQAVFGVAEMVDRFLLTNTQTEQALEISQEAREIAKDASDTANSAMAEVTHTLRTPLSEPAPKSLPSREARKNTVLAFDKDGEPSVTVPASGSAADVLLKLAADDGASRVGYGSSTVDEKLHSLDSDIAEVSGHLNDWQLPGAADKIPMLPGGTVQDSLSALTPEQFGAVGDGVTDDSAAIQAAIQYAYDNQKNIIVGYGRYLIGSTLRIDNFSFGLQINLAMLVVADTWPTFTSWKDAAPAFLIGAESNGSMVGLNINVGFFHGKDKATMFRLQGFGCGGSRFHVQRAQNFVIGFQCTESSKIGSSSNYISGDYWLQGTTALRVARSGRFVVEGTKFSVRFVTNMKYGGAQFYGGSQYSSIFNTDMDFSGQWLTELKVDKLPAGNIRGQNLASGVKAYEVLDYYEYPKGTYNILVIEDHNTINGNTDFKAGDTGTVAGVTYAVQSTRTTATNNFYFDVIHGFQGEPFSKFRLHCGYLGGIVGGVMFDSEIFHSNAYSSFTMNLKGLSVVHNGNFMRISDRYLQGQLFHMWPTRMDTFKHIRMGESRLYGTNVQTTLLNNETKVLRTFSLVGDGDVTNTKEVWEIIVAGPSDIGEVGGSALIFVGTNGVEVRSNQVAGVALSASGFSVRARQASQASMPITFYLLRRL